MKISIIAVGKIGRSPEHDLIERYKIRLPHPLNIIEVEEKRPIKVQERKNREGELLLSAVPEKTFLIILDEKGRDYSSIEFSKKIAGWRDQGLSVITFIIGGSDGLSDDVKARANLSISFGNLTWPHMLVRSMLVEQIYRAYTILNGHPYHKI
jgi:23S rRNA (pseudouridine1915-N3)-methyltransferase